MKKSKNRVSPETVARRLRQALARFPDPPEKRSRRADTKGHLIEALRGPLRDAIRQRGCSLADLVALLRESGLAVHPSTLKRHLGPVGDDREAYRRARSTSPPPPVPGAPSRPGEAGSPEALARLEAVLTGAPSGPPPAQAAPPTAPPVARAGADDPPYNPPDDPPHCPPGTFIPRPERPIDWYKPSS